MAGPFLALTNSLIYLFSTKKPFRSLLDNLIYVYFLFDFFSLRCNFLLEQDTLMPLFFLEIDAPVIF
jgi:hypothetical protein